MRRVFVALALAAAIFVPRVAGAAYFDRIEVGARGAALASAYGAYVSDVSAVYWNPAGLSMLDRPELLLSHGRPYWVPDLAANSVAAGTRLGEGGVAVSWHRLGLTDVVAENLLSVAYGHWVYRDDRRTLYAGAAAKFASVNYSDRASDLRDFGSESKVTGDLGLILAEGPKLRLGAVLRNLGEPEFDFVPGGAATPMNGGVELSASYQWRPESVILLNRSTIGGETSWNYGGEIWFYDVFAIRAGVRDEEFAGGFGIRGRAVDVDLGFLTHESLGNTYRASIRLRVPEKGGAQ
jgi:hypothetical protein